MTYRITPMVFIRESIFYGLLVSVGAIMFLPFLWALSTSFKLNEEIFTIPIRWLPSQITLDHYRTAFSTIPYGRYFLNSLFLAVAGVVSNLFLGSMAGYAFARMRFAGRNMFFKVLMASMMIPGAVTLVPSFIILRSIPFLGGNNWQGDGGFGLLNSYWAVILPGAAGAFAVFMMRQFFLTLPSELAEAARIDGAGEFRIFLQIYFPLAKPALATLALFTFQAGWNSFLWPLIVLNDPKLKTIQIGLQAFSYNKSTEYGALMAASMIAMLPMIALFIYAQRYFTQGIAFTGSK
jgi:multiple sugar transport system permease protein